MLDVTLVRVLRRLEELESIMRHAKPFLDCSCGSRRKNPSRVIEAILVGIPLPSMVFYENRDGSYHPATPSTASKLLAISDFVAGKYLLDGLAFFPELNGMGFEGLVAKNRYYHRRIMEYDVDVSLIDHSSKPIIHSLQDLFEDIEQ